MEPLTRASGYSRIPNEHWNTFGKEESLTAPSIVSLDSPLLGRVAVLAEPERFEFAAAEPPVPGPGHAVIRVRECGICGSDLKMWSGTHSFMRPPIVMGHEVIGTIAASGAGVAFEPGATVVLFPPVGCGACFHCWSGREQLCESMEFFGGQRSGGLADYVVAPATHILEVPNSVPAQYHVLIEPLAVAVHGVERAAPRPDELCVVIGAGAIGLFTALVLKSRGVEGVLVVEPLAHRRTLAESAGFRTLDPSAEDPVAGTRRLVRPEGADVVFECVGSQATIAASLAATRKGGRAVIVGNAPANIDLDGLTLQRGDRSLVGVLMYDLEDFRTAMNLLGDGMLDGLDEGLLVTRYGLDRVGDAFADAKSGRLPGLKAVIAP